MVDYFRLSVAYSHNICGAADIYVVFECGTVACAMETVATYAPQSCPVSGGTAASMANGGVANFHFLPNAATSLSLSVAATDSDGVKVMMLSSANYAAMLAGHAYSCELAHCRQNRACPPAFMV